MSITRITKSHNFYGVALRPFNKYMKIKFPHSPGQGHPRGGGPRLGTVVLYIYYNMFMMDGLYDDDDSFLSLFFCLFVCSMLLILVVVMCCNNKLLQSLRPAIYPSTVQ